MRWSSGNDIKYHKSITANLHCKISRMPPYGAWCSFPVHTFFCYLLHFLLFCLCGSTVYTANLTLLNSIVVTYHLVHISLHLEDHNIDSILISNLHFLILKSIQCSWYKANNPVYKRTFSKLQKYVKLITISVICYRLYKI